MKTDQNSWFQVVGHEIVGEAVRVGSEVKHVKVGDIVGVSAVSRRLSSSISTSSSFFANDLSSFRSEPKTILALSVVNARMTASPTVTRDKPELTLESTRGKRRQRDRALSVDTPTTIAPQVTSSSRFPTVSTPPTPLPFFVEELPSTPL